jgi:hypothetical protein
MKETETYERFFPSCTRRLVLGGLFSVVFIPFNLIILVDFRSVGAINSVGGDRAESCLT